MAEVAPARPSSTVVLARESGDGPEYLLVRRHAKSAFGSTFAFPGGVLEPADAKVRDRCTGVEKGEADRRLDVDGNGLDYYSAAIRELFEETGVLLADCCPDAEILDRCRSRLNAGRLAWRDFLAENGLSMRCDRLHYFSHWITPDALPRRYSTRFFVACLPDGQTACHDELELIDSRWTTARTALDDAANGEIEIPFPTRHTLEAIEPCRDVDALLAWADGCVEAGVKAIHPTLPKDDPRPRPVIEVGERRS